MGKMCCSWCCVQSRDTVQVAKNSALLRVTEEAWGWGKEHKALRVPAGCFESTISFLPVYTSMRWCALCAGVLTRRFTGSLRTRWQLDEWTHRNWALPNTAVRRKVLLQWHSDCKMKRARNERERRDGVLLCNAVSWWGKCLWSRLVVL